MKYIYASLLICVAAILIAQILLISQLQGLVNSAVNYAQQAFNGWKGAQGYEAQYVADMQGIYGTSTIVEQWAPGQADTISCNPPFVVTYHMLNDPSFGTTWFDTCSRPVNQWVTQ